MSNYMYLVRLVICKIIISLIPVLGINAQVSIQLEIDTLSPHFGNVLLSGLSNDVLAKLSTLREQKEWKQYLTVQLSDASGAALSEQSMLGKYILDRQQVIFQPRFPFLEGRHYLVKFTDQSNYQQIITIPEHAILVPTKVLSYYPSIAVIPENWLKLYLYFSAPMRKGQALEHIHCYDEEGKPIEQPFLDMGEELWDIEGKRLTLWLDPGRIKRYLHPNIAEGKPLEAGKTLMVVIDKDWKDANGKGLKEATQISYQIGKADRQKPNTEDWTFVYPQSASAPVEINFKEAMDHALLNSRIVILNEKNEAIEGRIELKNQESHWVFYPERAWLPGVYTLRLSTRLEDLAGNNLRRVFDRDLTIQSEEKQDSPAFLDFPFVIPEY